MGVRSVIAASLLGLLAGPAFAADFSVIEPAPAPMFTAEPTAPTWSGFYLGALFGYNWGNSDTDRRMGAPGSVDIDGIDGGIYAGGAVQMDSFVVGLEGDLLLSGASGSAAIAPGAGGGRLTLDQNWSGSLRARAGIALDQFMLYGTGGVAMTGVEMRGPGGSDQNNLLGWTLGAGAEALLTDSVTARVEYRYSDYENKTFSLGGADVNADLQSHSVRAGVGVRF